MAQMGRAFVRSILSVNAKGLIYINVSEEFILRLLSFYEVYGSVPMF